MAEEWDQISTDTAGKVFKPENDLPHADFFNDRWTAYFNQAPQTKEKKKKK